MLPCFGWQVTVVVGHALLKRVELLANLPDANGQRLQRSPSFETAR